MNDSINQFPAEAPPGPPPTPVQKPLLHRIFLGPSGIRPGWRLLIYLVGFFVLLAAISFLLRRYFAPPVPHQPPRLRAMLAGECISLFAAVVPALFMARLERRPFGAYGLPRQRAFGKLFWLGIVWGIAAISALLLIMRGTGVFQISGIALHGMRVLEFGVFWAVLFLVVGFFEEFLTRGYTQFTLTQAIGFWPTAFLFSAAFGALHLGNKGEGWIGALGAACIGLFFCLTLRRTGTLWFAVGMHAAWDWGETFFYSVPDSGLIAPGHLMNSSFHGSWWLTGGTVGPEGSVLLFVIIVALWILFDRLYPEVKYKAAA